MWLGPTKHFQKVGANMWLGPIKDVGPRRWENVGKELGELPGELPDDLPGELPDILPDILLRGIETDLR